MKLKRKLVAVEMKCLRSMFVVTRVERLRNEDVRDRINVREKLNIRMNQNSGSEM